MMLHHIQFSAKVDGALAEEEEKHG